MFISENISTHNWILVIFLIFLNYMFRSLIDIIDKYLLEYLLLNPFLLIMVEGIVGILLSSLHILIKNPFKEVKTFYKNNNKTKFCFFTICLILYFIISGGKNSNIIKIWKN